MATTFNPFFIDCKRAQATKGGRESPLPGAAAQMSNIKGIDDVKEENDDEKRQAYYAGGQGQNGGGRQASTAPLLPSECPGGCAC